MSCRCQQREIELPYIPYAKPGHRPEPERERETSSHPIPIELNCNNPHRCQRRSRSRSRVWKDQITPTPPESQRGINLGVALFSFAYRRGVVNISPLVTTGLSLAALVTFCATTFSAHCPLPYPFLACATPSLSPLSSLFRLALSGAISGAPLARKKKKKKKHRALVPGLSRPGIEATVVAFVSFSFFPCPTTWVKPLSRPFYCYLQYCYYCDDDDHDRNEHPLLFAQQPYPGARRRPCTA